ncbi:MAG: CTQ-dependent lysine 6-oxidase LodA [Pseudomonadota bacterium]|nr:CTQ-dependent lysine 6-oxidase LodA [Pseudomonadota bacterium]
MTTYLLSPSIGIARLGNSPTDFYLSPERIGGLPLECDANGNATDDAFSSFKDDSGRIKRQAQPFRILRTTDNTNYEELTLESKDVTSIEWTVHLANKKAAWYQFSELQGNLLLGPDNSYANQKVALRNNTVTDPSARQKLIIDPGPRTVTGANQSVEIGRDNIPSDYPHGSFPSARPLYGWPVNSLGTLKTDSAGRLLVLGGYGRAGGDEPIQSYGGADTWYDDIADGPVYCTLKLSDGSEVNLSGWVTCGSPDFAPEIVNISNLDDTMFDVGVRCQNLVPEMYSRDTWNSDYIASYQRDILPIIQRISRYQWVSNVQSMSAFCSNVFDYRDSSAANAANREQYFSYFRKPTAYTSNGIQGQSSTLFSDDNLPMMPLNSGSNSVNNVDIEKFLTLDQTQYFLLSQWAAGKFIDEQDYLPRAGACSATAAAVGNCVGLPMCPGIEMTWSMQNPAIYAAPYRIAQHGDEASYRCSGLAPSRDETEGGGCEPGDLTKRMAIPWQADFFNCTIQYVNFSDPDINKVNGMPLPPSYYAYWWPPQAPWDVLTGDLTANGQAAAHTPAGLQVNYARGINSYVQMITEWSYLGFIRNQTSGAARESFPYMVETERKHDMFQYQDVPVSQISGNPDDSETTIPVWYSKPTQKLAPENAKLLQVRAEEELFREIAVAESQRQRTPRRGTRARH